MLSPSGRELKKKITNKTAKVSVIGLGYVGLPLAIEIGKAGFSVIGIDIDKEKVNKVNNGKSYIPDVVEEELSKLVSKNKLIATIIKWTLSKYCVGKEQRSFIMTLMHLK